MSSRIRLAVNARRLVPGKIGGLENAFRDVFDILLRRYRDEFEVTILTSFHAEDSFGSWQDLVRVRLVPEEKAPGSLAAALEGQDILYCPFFQLDPPEPTLPSVLMIPDLQHEEFPEFFPPEVLAHRLHSVRSGVCLATRVLTISEFTKRHILRRFHVPDEHVAVAHLDCASAFREAADPQRLADLRRALDLPDTYLLFPANNWPHKNHRGLFRALGEYRRRFGGAPHVILTGAEVEGVDLRGEAAAAGVADLVRHVGFVEKRDVPLLYDGAAGLVFVTLFEGFGIPVVEAMRRGTPVIASNTTSIPEIAGDHALLVDPHDTGAIAEALHEVLDRPEQARARAEQAKSWVRRFSHDATADKTAELFREVAATDLAARPRSACRPEAKPSVFIITPSHDQGEFLADTVDSVLAQDHDNLDYLVADCGSADDSVAVLESFGDRVKWVSKPDGGPVAAINEAWRRSDAEIVAWINSGDTYLPGAISAAVRYLLAHPEAAMVYGNAWYTDRDGNETETYPTKTFDPQLLRSERFICQPSTFVRREVFEVIDLLDPGLDFCVDHDLWIRLSEHFGIGYVDQYLATSRASGEDESPGQRQAARQEFLSVVRKHDGHAERRWPMGYAKHATNKLVERVFWSLPSFLQRLAYGVLSRRHHREQQFGSPPYVDGWAASRTELSIEPVDDGCVTVEAESPYWPYLRKLVIHVEHEGKVIAEHKVARRGPFSFSFRVPARRAVTTRLVLCANRTFDSSVLGTSGDGRALSFRILDVKS